MLAVAATLGVVLVDRDPLLFPGLLLLCGLGGSLMASLRGRALWPHGRRVAVAGYIVLAIVGFVTGGVALGYRAQLFWGARWEENRNELVLERLGPLGEIRIDCDDVERVTEISAPERTISGPRRAVQFVVRTRSGQSYWSAPLYRRGRADSARETLVAAAGPRLERFLIGTSPLPQ
jgi:hypothetical protein